jgi:hypothetical protein
MQHGIHVEQHKYADTANFMTYLLGVLENNAKRTGYQKRAR